MLHGHNGRLDLTIGGDIKSNGMILDFKLFKEHFFNWVDDNWDHRMLLHKGDRLFTQLIEYGAVGLDFNPTAENMALYLLEVIFPMRIRSLNIDIIGLKLYETKECFAEIRSK